MDAAGNEVLGQEPLKIAAKLVVEKHIVWSLCLFTSCQDTSDKGGGKAVTKQACQENESLNKIEGGGRDKQHRKLVSMHVFHIPCFEIAKSSKRPPPSRRKGFVKDRTLDK